MGETCLSYIYSHCDLCSDSFMSLSTLRTNLQLNKRILSFMIFTFVCYLTIGLPLAVLPSFVHNSLGYNSVLAGLIISVQYFATLISRPHAGRYADQLGPKKVVIFGLICCGMSGVFYALAFIFAHSPLASYCCFAWREFSLASEKVSAAPVPRCGGSARWVRNTRRG